MVRLRGLVIRGNGYGKKLGFPTANLEIENPGERPQDGIYACWVNIGEEKERYQGALHVGPRPAVRDMTSTVEVHILNFPERDLLGQNLTLTVIHRLRDVKNFASPEELARAIAQDCEDVRRTLNGQ